MRVSIASPLTRPSPNGRRVGIRIVTFEACSGFTLVTARRIAQPPEAAFVTRLQPFRLPGRAARQLPDQSTTLWVESSSTGDPRLRGALPTSDIPLRTSTVQPARRWANNIGGVELLLRHALNCVDTEFGVLFSMCVSFRVSWRSKRSLRLIKVLESKQNNSLRWLTSYR